MSELEECERQISEVQIALVEYVSSLSANDLLKILAHKLNMQDKMLALVEVHKIGDDLYDVGNSFVNDIITYGVGK